MRVHRLQWELGRSLHGSVTDAGDQVMSFIGAKVQLERDLRKRTQIREREEGERNKTEKREEDEKLKLTMIRDKVVF